LKARFAIFPVFAANARQIFIKVEASAGPPRPAAKSQQIERRRLTSRAHVNRVFTMAD
jgi:hypothetical protein